MQPAYAELRSPESFLRRVLLCVAGTTPAVITETLYALAVNPARGRNRFVPTEIRVVTTRKGRDLIATQLIDREYHRLLADYPRIEGLDQCRFDNDSIATIHDSGRVLDDIVTASDNDRAADRIMQIVRELAEHPDADNTAIHASLAGGRKTMGFYLGYCLSLFGRPQDRLSHVLVTAPYDDCADFFYPTPEPRMVHPSTGSPKNAMNARVELADVPVVLWSGLARGRVKLPDPHLSYTDVVRRYSSGLEDPQLTIHFSVDGVQIRCGKFVFPLRGETLVFYIWLAVRRLRGLGGLHHQDPLKESALVDEFTRVADAVGHSDVSGLKDKDSDQLKSYFQQRKTNVEALAQENAVPRAYLIQTVQMNANARLAKTGPVPSRYGLDCLSPDNIHVTGPHDKVDKLHRAIDNVDAA